jgi:hypothetical protein
MNVPLTYDFQYNIDLLHLTRLACYQVQTLLEEEMMNSPANMNEKELNSYNFISHI